MTAPLTVLMAVYNGLPYVRDAVQSILAQGGVDFLFLIIDDASTDGTPEYLASLDDPRLQIVHNARNLGLTLSLNEGLAIAQTPCIARMDADDLSLPGRLAAQAAFMDAHPQVVLLGTSAQRIDERGRPLDTLYFPTGDAQLRAQLRAENQFTHGAVIFRREAALALGGYRAGFRDAQDYDLWLRLAEVGQLANLPQVLYQQRRHASAKSVLKKPRQTAFRELAGQLAAVRARGEDDTVLYERETAAIMQRHTPESLDGRARRRLLAGHWLAVGVHHLRQRRYLTGAGLVLRALLRDPLEPGLWRGIRSGLRRLVMRG